MPDNVSALQLLLTADPALLAIVRLSLIVSLSAVVRTSPPKIATNSPPWTSVRSGGSRR
jgi:ABC-type tungstate transport system substrate-binding protein